MDEPKKTKGDGDLQEVLARHVCDLVDNLEEMDPVSNEYAIVEDAVDKLSNLLIKMDEIQLKYGNEVDQRNFEMKLKKLEIEASMKAREAEEKLRLLEQQEARRSHNIETGIKIAGLCINVISTMAFLGTAWVQTRANYCDNIYDVSQASRMILSAIGKLVKPNGSMG